MRSCGVRALAPAEREELAALATDHRRRAALAMAAILASPALCFAAAATDSQPAVLAVCFASLVGVSAALLFGGESLRSARLLARAARDPRVETFEGTIAPDAVRDPQMTSWIRAGSIDPAHASIEVLAGSGLPWSRNGARVASLRALRIVDVGVPDRAAGDGVRELSASERAEVARHAAEASRIGIVPVYLIGIATAWALIIAREGAAAVVGVRPLIALLLGAGALVIALVRRHGAARLRRDAARGIVAVVEGGEHRLELLPEDRRLWTLDGAPAPYRTH